MKKFGVITQAVIAVTIVIATAYWFFLPGGVSKKEPDGKSGNVQKLSGEVVERISSGDVFLTYWHSDQFVRFSELTSPHFDNTKFAVVLIHGLFESAADEWLANMATQIAKVEPDTEILAVDWAKFALKGKKNLSWATVTGDVISAYTSVGNDDDVTKLGWWKNLAGELASKKSTKQMLEIADVVKSIPLVADAAAEYLFGETGLKLQPDVTHIIGFSHGAHVGGLIGKKTDGTLRRLTLLDPSTRLVHFGNINAFGTGWDSQSAKFTDMYQTSYWAGSGKAYGHKTFKVVMPGTEKSRLPPGPAEDARRHSFAPKWFASTVGSQHQDYGYSMTIPDNGPFQEGGWTGTITGTLSENPNGVE